MDDLATAVAKYRAELDGPVPIFSTSHNTLYRLYRRFGSEAVDAELKKQLVNEFAKEVGDSHEWPNKDNVTNTEVALLAYISQLENPNE